MIVSRFRYVAGTLGLVAVIGGCGTDDKAVSVQDVERQLLIQVRSTQAKVASDLREYHAAAGRDSLAQAEQAAIDAVGDLSVSCEERGNGTLICRLQGRTVQSPTRNATEAAVLTQVYATADFEVSIDDGCWRARVSDTGLNFAARGVQRLSTCETLSAEQSLDPDSTAAVFLRAATGNDGGRSDAPPDSATGSAGRIDRDVAQDSMACRDAFNASSAVAVAAAAQFVAEVAEVAETVTGRIGSAAGSCIVVMQAGQTDAVLAWRVDDDRVEPLTDGIPDGFVSRTTLSVGEDGRLTTDGGLAPVAP